MTIPRSHRPDFFKPGLWDRGMTFRFENVFEKKNENNPVCETLVWSLADQVKNLIEKKWPGLSDSDMVTGGLKGTSLNVTQRNKRCQPSQKSISISLQFWEG